MEKNDNTPLWVFLAFSSLSTRRAALILISACLLFSIYCVPWPLLFSQSEWVAKVFLIDDWSWLAMMVPMTLWYLVSLKWMDRHMAWEIEKQEVC